MLRGSLAPVSLNDSATFFVPKVEFAFDADAICREPLETRPLSLKNSDNKVCAAVTNRSLIDVVKQCTHKTQNGFAPGRQLIQNPVDLDSAGRMFSMIADDENARKTPKPVPTPFSTDQDPLQEDGPQGNRSPQDGPYKGGQKFMKSVNKFPQGGLDEGGQDFNNKQDFVNPEPAELTIAILAIFWFCGCFPLSPS